MNLEQAGHFIRHPQELQLSHAEALKSLAARHPYSSVYALLYLTALANGKSPDLDDALAANAYRLSDRTRLYHLLTQSGENVGKVENVESVENIPPVKSANENQTEDLETVENMQPAEEDIDDSKAQPANETQQAETVEPSEEVVNETANTENEAIDDAHPEAERKTEAEIGFDFEKITTAHSLEQFLELPQEKQSESVQETEHSEEIPASEEDENDPGAAEDHSETDEKRSFTSWLRSANTAPPKAAKPVEPAVPKSKASDLIEKFIKEEPSITRSKTEFFSPSKRAKESLSEDTAPVSETLAKIYAAQGNYPKAIHVYHQLMLSVPEKKSLFAVRIEELKKKITQ